MYRQRYRNRTMDLTHELDPLLKQLQHDARATPEALAAMTGGDVEEVRKTIREWEEDGTILGYHAVVDSEKAGSEAVRAHISVDLRPEDGHGFDRLAARIARFDEVKDCFLMSGGADLVVVVEGSSLQEVAQFVARKLSTMDGVQRTMTAFQLSCYKQNGFLADKGMDEDRLSVTP